MKKRILALFLALICLAASVLMFSSCANTDEGKNVDNNINTENLDHIANLDFGGADVNFIIADADGDDYHYRSIYIKEEDADDTLNSKIYERNIKVQTLLNVNIVANDDAHKDTSLKEWFGATLQACDQSYDVIAARQYDDIQLALDGCILDLNTLDQYGADYIKWDREYWATSYIDSLSFGDKTFWLTGDLCLRYTGGYYAIFVNSSMYDDILRPTYGDIYDIVRSGNWTLDMLTEMVQQCYKDDGNDKLDVEDQLGLMYPINDNTNGLAISSGVIFTRYDDGIPKNNVNAGNTTLINFMNKLRTLINTTGVYFYPDPCDVNHYIDAFTHFAAGNVCFVSGRLNMAELYLRDMETDYYVIPCPKYDTQQETYYTAVHDGINIYGINYHIEDERIASAAATLEAMAYYSYKDVRPVYYDSFLKFKYTRDDNAAEMIDLMHDSVYTDFVYIWQFSKDMNDLGFFLRRNLENPNITSVIKKRSASWDLGLEQILAKIESFDQG